MSRLDTSTATDHTLRLPDGRTLGSADSGNAGGAPLFHFHGHPGFRLEARFLATAAAAVGVRLIGIDRPGMGRSTYQPGRRVLDWPDDVVVLADHCPVAPLAAASPDAALRAGCGKRPTNVGASRAIRPRDTSP